MVLASLPGLFAAVAADLVERERVRARAGVRRRERGWGGAGRRLRASTLRAVGALGGIVVGASVAGLPGAAMGGLAAIIIPVVRARRKMARRAEMMQEQLAQAVSVIAAGLRTGLSLLQAISLSVLRWGRRSAGSPTVFRLGFRSHDPWTVGSPRSASPRPG